MDRWQRLARTHTDTATETGWPGWDGCWDGGDAAVAENVNMEDCFLSTSSAVPEQHFLSRD